MDEIKKLLEEQKSVWEAFKTELNRIEASGKNVQKEWSEKAQQLNDRLDQIETALKRPNAGTPDAECKSNKNVTEAEKKYVLAFDAYVHGDENAVRELKSLSTDNDTSGGYLVPSNRVQSIIQKLILTSPIRALAEVVTISAGDSLEQPKEGATNFAAGWTAERGTRTETTAADLKMEKIPAHEMYANPFVTQKMLDDAAFGFEAWMNQRLAEAFAVSEGLSFVSGSGVGQPEGLLTYGGADLSQVVTGSAAALTADGLISLLYDLPSFYAKTGVWLMNRATISAVRKLKDSQNQYLWSPGFSGAMANPQPDTILGRPVVEVPDMPNVAANAFPIIFGDVRRAFRIVDRTDIRVLRDPYSNKPYVTFYTTKRVGGQVVLGEALRKQKCSV